MREREREISESYRETDMQAEIIDQETETVTRIETVNAST